MRSTSTSPEDSGLDLDLAEERFAQSVDLTIGLEEEFAILRKDTLDLHGGFEGMYAAARARDPFLADGITGELISAEIEIISGRAEDLAEAFARQRDRRRRLFALADAEGCALGATGTHPWADYRAQAIIDTAHYRRVADGLRYVAARNNTFSLHVHVGVNGADRALKVCDRLRPLLPLLLAVSANSPWVDGRDSGLHSARTQTFTRSFPRCGVPDAFGSWDAYRRYVELLVATSSIVESTQIWWSVRPHFAFGTVEVRICDAQSSGSESEALASLIVACVAQALRDLDEGVPTVDLPPRLIEENIWRAIRFGLDGRMLDFEHDQEYPSAAIVERLAAWTAPTRAELGIELGFPERNGAQRQRALIAAGASREEVFAAAVREARDTYAQEVTV